VDAKGEPLKATSYMAVGFYVAKYVNKKSDMGLAAKGQIGRASCRERAEIWEDGVSLKINSHGNDDRVKIEAVGGRERRRVGRRRRTTEAWDEAAAAEGAGFFFKQKKAYEIGLGIPAEPLFRSLLMLKVSRLKLPVIWLLVSMWLNTLTKSQIWTLLLKV